MHRTLTDEQNAICQAVAQGENLYIIAKAGTGKTYTSVRALSDAGHKALFLMFNKALKADTRIQVNAVGADIEVHSFHACALRYFSVTGKRSDGWLEQALQQTPRKPLTDFTYLAIDEAQDLKPLYHRFIRHVLSFMPQTTRRMLLVGDPFQNINQYLGANITYLIEPGKHYGDLIGGASTFQPYRLSISWRLSHEMCAFVNQHCNPIGLKPHVASEWWSQNGTQLVALWGDGIHAAPSRKPEPDSVLFVLNAAFWGRNARHLQRQMRSVSGLQFLAYLERNLETYTHDTALIAHSVQSKGVVKPLVQNIVNAFGTEDTENWYVDRTRPEDRGIDAVRQNKRLATTVHKVKGREHDFVIFPEFSAFWHQLAARSKGGAWSIFNVMYTALTRARKCLLITCDKQPYVTFARGTFVHGKKRKNTYNAKSMPVKDLFTHVPYDDVLSQKTLTWKPCTVPGQAKALTPCRFIVPGRCAGVLENIAPILGTALEFKLAHLLYGTNPFLEDLQVLQRCKDDSMLEWIQDAIDRGRNDATVDTFCKLALISQYLHDGFLSPWRQLAHYNWAKHQQFLDDAGRNVVYQLYALAFPTKKPSDDITIVSQALVPITHLQYDMMLPWPNDPAIPSVKGVVDVILHNRIFVELKVSQQAEVDQAYAHQTQFYATMENVRPARSQDIEAYLIVANKAETYHLGLQKPQTHYDYINRTIKRKASTSNQPDQNRYDNDQERIRFYQQLDESIPLVPHAKRRKLIIPLQR